MENQPFYGLKFNIVALLFLFIYVQFIYTWQNDYKIISPFLYMWKIFVKYFNKESKKLDN